MKITDLGRAAALPSPVVECVFIQDEPSRARRWARLYILPFVADRDSISCFDAGMPMLFLYPRIAFQHSSPRWNGSRNTIERTDFPFGHFGV